MNKWIAILCGALTACCTPSAEDSQEHKLYKIELGSLIDQNVQQISLSEWSKNYKFIPLVTNDPIKSIKKILLSNNKLLILHSDKLSLFKLDGEYLYDIGEKGTAENEHRRFYGFFTRNDTIFIRGWSYNFMLYNWEGTFLGNKKTPELRFMQDVYPIPDSDVTLGYIKNISGQEEARFAFFRDTTILRIIPNQNKYERVTGEMVWSFIPEMKAFDGAVPAFKELFNDTIYQIDSDHNLSPYAVINLDKHKAKKEFVYSLTPEMVFQENFDIFNGKIALTAIGEKDDIIYLVPYNSIDKPYTFSFDKKSGKSYYQKITYPENQTDLTDGSVFTPSYISSDGKYLIDFEFTKADNTPVIVLVER